MQRPLGITLNRTILDSQRLHPKATGDLSGLLNELIVAAKTISAEVNMAGLTDIIGMSGKKNIYGEKMLKLDEFANNAIKQRMSRSGYLCIMGSEEDAGPIPVQEGLEGKYVLHFDPMDGSGNIDVNGALGTIFSIYRRRSGWGPGNINDLLQKGRDQVAAGYIIYGSSTVLVFSTGEGVHGFTLDPTVGEFYLSHHDIRFLDRSRYYSVNEGYTTYWDEKFCRYIAWLKDHEPESGRPYSIRYVGSLVADFHRNLIAGGIFLYPGDRKTPERATGKLRLLFEAAPLAFIAEQAGGRAITGDGRNILDIEPERLHQTVPLIIGNAHDVAMAEKFLLG